MALTPRAVEAAIAGGAVVVDARTNEQFDEAHIPGAISASAYDTGFATKVAHVVDENVEVIVVAASDGYELEAAKLLASVGVPVRGFLEGGMTTWRSEERPVERIPMRRPAGPRPRRRRSWSTCAAATDFAAGHIPGSVHIPYAELRRPLRRAAARPSGRDDLLGGQAQRPRRVDPAARGLRRRPARHAGRRRRLAGRARRSL